MSEHVKVEPTNGKIIIDGIDISTIGVYDLRSKMVSSQPTLPLARRWLRFKTFIPQVGQFLSFSLQVILTPLQDATLFSGTLRENLDPFGTWRIILVFLPTLMFICRWSYWRRMCRGTPPCTHVCRRNTPGPEHKAISQSFKGFFYARWSLLNCDNKRRHQAKHLSRYSSVCRRNKFLPGSKAVDRDGQGSHSSKSNNHLRRSD